MAAAESCPFGSDKQAISVIYRPFSMRFPVNRMSMALPRFSTKRHSMTTQVTMMIMNLDWGLQQGVRDPKRGPQSHIISGVKAMDSDGDAVRHSELVDQLYFLELV